MNIVFMGTPDFAVESLSKIYDNGHEVLAVVSQPDRPSGRGMKLKPTPVKEYAEKHGANVVVISARIEAELAELSPEEAKDYLMDLGVTNSGIERMVQAVYKLLDLTTFITAGEKEVRAWTVKTGSKAPKAAGVIHTDFEKGFIRAEVTSYKDFVECGSYTVAREKGLTRLEGKEYVIQDGDLVHFRFNV